MSDFFLFGKLRGYKCTTYTPLTGPMNTIFIDIRYPNSGSYDHYFLEVQHNFEFKYRLCHKGNANAL